MPNWFSREKGTKAPESRPHSPLPPVEVPADLIDKMLPHLDRTAMASLEGEAWIDNAHFDAVNRAEQHLKRIENTVTAQEQGKSERQALRARSFEEFVERWGKLVENSLRLLAERKGWDDVQFLTERQETEFGPRLYFKVRKEEFHDQSGGGRIRKVEQFRVSFEQSYDKISIYFECGNSVRSDRIISGKQVNEEAILKGIADLYQRGPECEDIKLANSKNPDRRWFSFFRRGR